jgi:hypothetical protein
MLIILCYIMKIFKKVIILWTSPKIKIPGHDEFHIMITIIRNFDQQFLATFLL